MPAPAKSWGYIYIVRSLERYKIGYTGNLRTMEKRLNRLHHLNAYGIEKVLILRSRRAHILETQLHQRYHYCRANGEWFELTPDDIEQIKRTYTRELFEVCQ